MLKYKVGDVFKITNPNFREYFSDALRVGARLTIESVDEGEDYELSVPQLGYGQCANDAALDDYCTLVAGPSYVPVGDFPADREPPPAPPHYLAGRPAHYEPRFVIAAWGLGYNLGSAVKYIARAGRKGGPADHIRDLEKARDFLKFEIERLQGAGHYGNNGKAE